MRNLMLVTCLLLPLAAAADGDSRLPVIHFPEMEFDFGTVPQHEKISHVFRVENAGFAPLVIHEAKGT